MTQSLISQGLELMLYGMGSVLVFLALLVLVTSLMSSLLGAQDEVTATSPTSAGLDVAVDPRTLAVISAAVHAHRQRQKPLAATATAGGTDPSQRRSSES